MQDHDIKEVLSEYLDQGLAPARADALLARLKSEPELQSTALSYWVISEALSGVAVTQQSNNLQERIARSLQREPHFMPQHHRLANVGAGPGPGQVRPDRRGLGTGLRFAAGLAAFGFVASVVWTVGVDGLSSGSPAVVALSSTPVQPSSNAFVSSNFSSPQIRAMVEAHGPMIVRMRMDEQ